MPSETPRSPCVLLQATDPDGESRWWHFRDPVAVVTAERTEDVLDALAEVERALGRGLYAAGFLSYEAAPGLDPALVAHAGGPLPLAWWGLFERPHPASPPAPPAAAPPRLDWRPTIGPAEHQAAIAEIHRRIAIGDTYQVNYTFALETAFEGDAFALFAALAAAQGGRCSAYVDTGRFALCSSSPELFFTLDGDRLTSRPMKGTAPRGRYPQEDRRLAAELRASGKERAENVMIVDMMRNDLGKVARSGTVRVDELFRLETYPTLHQLTSTVSARSAAPISEILRALYPSASITGAPKIRTSSIIRDLETEPRGAYTGSIGFLSPNRRAHLNVAIRTVTVDREAGQARYGTGSGIVWDSDAGREYEECRTKALVLSAAPEPFELFETLLWRGASGYFLLERHLERLSGSAAYFGFRYDEDTVRRRLAAAVQGGSTAERSRVRLLLGRDGRVRTESEPMPRARHERFRIGLDSRSVESRDVFLFHKTTRRRRYEEALERRRDLDEVILWNERHELTESTRANLVLKLGGEYLTPPVDCGLLPGTFRGELVRRGCLREQVLSVESLGEADEVFLVNALRGVVRTRRTPERMPRK